MAAPVCPTCAARLEGGYLLDRPHNGTAISNWVEGPPERNMWGLNTRGRRILPMYAWRCPQCTEVRLFAPEG